MGYREEKNPDFVYIRETIERLMQKGGDKYPPEMHEDILQAIYMAWKKIE